MTGDERFQDLWTDYLEGELGESGLADLRALLAGDERRQKLAADLYQTHRLLGLAAGESAPARDEFVRQTLARLPADGDTFTRRVMGRLGDRPAETPEPPRPPSRMPARLALAVAAVGLAAAALLAVALWPDDRTPQPGRRNAGAVRLASAAGARFFGELSPPVRSALAARRDYVLVAGLVELAFPCGASAIVEGPAVFRVLPDGGLGLDVGRCSVHAPPGAEGFRVETPVTRVVDRGTRFAVSVAETSETEVQVIEGRADVYGRPESLPKTTAGERVSKSGEPALAVQLTSREARRFGGPRAGDVTPTRFTPSAYRSGLPDRVVSYEATTGPDGGAEHLTGVTVQRGGTIRRYPAERLIPVELTWFRAADGIDAHGHLAGGTAPLPARRADLLGDTALNTGVINPGGSVQPPDADPLADGRDLPGFAVRFRTPVVNRPGPDVVFFELQTALNPPDGDAFHVSPLDFRGGRRSHTIRVYDLTVTSPEALKLAPFHLYQSAAPVPSLAALEVAEVTRRPRSSSFHALAVGIDLSDLGYRDGESVEGLFFQDAEDDSNRVDPVLIAGLPEE